MPSYRRGQKTGKRFINYFIKDIETNVCIEYISDSAIRKGGGKDVLCQDISLVGWDDFKTKALKKLTLNAVKNLCSCLFVLR